MFAGHFGGGVSDFPFLQKKTHTHPCFRIGRLPTHQPVASTRERNRRPWPLGRWSCHCHPSPTHRRPLSVPPPGGNCRIPDSPRKKRKKTNNKKNVKKKLKKAPKVRTPMNRNLILKKNVNCFTYLRLWDSVKFIASSSFTNLCRGMSPVKIPIKKSRPLGGWMFQHVSTLWKGPC